MQIEEFVQNVYKWGCDRDLYNNSTERAQVSKFLEELREYWDSDTLHETTDAIGDMAVCIVNAGYCKDIDYWDDVGDCHDLKLILMGEIGETVDSCLRGFYSEALLGLSAMVGDKIFEKCMIQAWEEIKDRKGKMVNGKFVKEA